MRRHSASFDTHKITDQLAAHHLGEVDLNDRATRDTKRVLRLQRVGETQQHGDGDIPAVLAGELGQHPRRVRVTGPPEQPRVTATEATHTRQGRRPDQDREQVWQVGV
mgnify:CR=1 FL=1